MRSALLLALCSCAGAPVTDTTSNDELDRCEESDRSAVTDPSAISDGMTFAPQVALDALNGDWTGTWTPIGGSETDASLSLTSGAVEFVEQTLVAGSGQGGGGDPQCSSYYAIAASVQLSTADHGLAETFDTEVQTRDATSAAFATSIPLSDVGGSVRPSFDPSKWDHTVLAVYATYANPALDGGGTWQGFDDASSDDGTVAPSGQTEGAGSFSLHR
jgi:hypothetical protein